MEERVIYLIRHGSILQESSERRFIGQLDISLSEAGIRQAKQLQAEFAKKKIAAIFCSDLIRSIDTAKIIVRKLKIDLTIKAALREISMGAWEGKTFSEIAKAFPEEYAKRGKHIASYQILGAESFEEGQVRIVEAFHDIMTATKGDILIVGHAGVNRLLLCHILGMSIENMFHISQDYGCINILIGNQGHYRIKLLNGGLSSNK